MKFILSLTLYLIGILPTLAQIHGVKEKFVLPDSLSEVSGAIFYNGNLIVHNDSGDENVIYELDTLRGDVIRVVRVTNATQIDWEDITQDSNSIYIGDIGNNNGNRKDLKVYKIAKSDYNNSDSVTAEVISFNYVHQQDFTAKPNQTVWDAESLMSLNDSQLILLSKDWVNKTSQAYIISKNPGNYGISPTATSLKSAGLITGATFNPETGKVYTIGYSSFLQPFIWVGENFSGVDIFSGTNTKKSLTGIGIEQVEAITYINNKRYFILSETFKISTLSDKGKLISFETHDNKLHYNYPEAIKITVFPNPSNGKFKINKSIQATWKLKVIDIKGQVIKLDTIDAMGSYILNLEYQPKGIYLLSIIDRGNVQHLRLMIK